MKRFFIIIATGLASASLLTGCQGMLVQSEDARINAAIKGKLVEEEQVDLSRVGVDTGNSTVYLTGAVPTSEQKKRIERIAREQTSGPVINRLHIWPIMDDATITSSVRGRLMTDPMINASQIGVDTRQGTVSLHGVVPSQDQRVRAEFLAGDSQGVRQVVNNLQVSMVPPPQSLASTIPNDPMITATVKDRLTLDRMANLARVRVDTTEGTVFLNGVVPSTEHKIRAEQIARDVRGVNQVVNNLQVQP